MIRFLLKRQYPPDKKYAVMGELFHNGFKICDTLEPPTGELEGRKYGKNFCVPPGTYQVRLTNSYRFKKLLPELLDVPGRSGIRIHSGNTDRDTQGCIIPGKRVADNPYYVSNSRDALAIIISLIRKAGNIAEIEII